MFLEFHMLENFPCKKHKWKLSKSIQNAFYNNLDDLIEQPLSAMVYT